MATLEIENMSKEFDGGAIEAVDDLSLEIEDGEFVVIVGPSGCGKSTTLNSIAGLETPTSGTISIDGVDVTGTPPQKRDAAMVFQNYALYPHMDAAANIEFGLKMSTDLSKAERRERVQEAAALLQVEDQLDKRPGELSGGQQQRIALGRAIVREPAVFLMDEPLSNLDAKLRSEMRTEIQELQNSIGVTTVYVTHDQTEAMTMGDRIVIMNGGRLQQIATPQEAYHEPANRFVAGFIGEPSMNFFDVSNDDASEGTLEFDLGDDHEDAEGVSYELPDPAEHPADLPHELVLGIRPNHVELTDDPDFEAEVTVVEPMGEYDLVHIDLAGHSYTVKADGDETPEEGTVSGFAIPWEHVHLFDRRSGEAVHHPRRRQVPA